PGRVLASRASSRRERARISLASPFGGASKAGHPSLTRAADWGLIFCRNRAAVRRLHVAAMKMALFAMAESGSRLPHNPDVVKPRACRQVAHFARALTEGQTNG